MQIPAPHVPEVPPIPVQILKPCTTQPVSHRDLLLAHQTLSVPCKVGGMPWRGEQSGQHAVTQPGSPREWQDDTHLPGPLSTHPCTKSKVHILPSPFTSLGRGGTPKPSCIQPSSSGCCIWSESIQVLQLPAFIYKLSPVRDEPQSVS